MSLAGSGARPAAQSSLLGGRSARVGGSPNPATRPPAEASFFRRDRVECEVMKPSGLPLTDGMMGYAFSRTMAMPWPPPMHSDARPYLWPAFFICMASV